MKRVILIAAGLSVGMSLAGWRGRFDEQFAVATSTARLPAEYQEVEYLESTGTQYIDTGVYPNENTLFEVAMSAYIFVGGAAAWPLYARGPIVGNRYGFSPSYGTSNKWAYVYAGGTYGGTIWTDQNWIIENHSGHPHELFVNGVMVASGQARTSVQSSVTFWLFAGNSSGVPWGAVSARISASKFWDGALTNPVRDLVPAVRKSDSVAGMYDLVSKQFFTNQGTGEFIVGPNIEE